MYERLQNAHFMKNRKFYYAITVALIVIMLAIGLVRGFNWGIDFTGGTLIQLDMGKTVELSDVKKVLNDNDLDGTVIFAGDDNKEIIIKTKDSLDTEVRTDLMEAMKKAFGIEDDALQSVSNIGPSVGDTLRKSAVKSVLAAVIFMLLYIAVRFMFKYGIAAILALANTILIMIGFYGAFHVTINSPFIAAVLTVLGYGINDTIVIFDRIRENTGGRNTRHTMGKLEDRVDESIRQTVGRSLMTSLTTIAVMVPILIICGDTIRSFILPILVGVIASTCSSIFIAPALWYDIVRMTDTDSYEARIRRKEKEKKKNEKAEEKERQEREKRKAEKEAARQEKLKEKKKLKQEAKAALEAEKAAAEEAAREAEAEAAELAESVPESVDDAAVEAAEPVLEAVDGTAEEAMESAGVPENEEAMESTGAPEELEKEAARIAGEQEAAAAEAVSTEAEAVHEVAETAEEAAESAAEAVSDPESAAEAAEVTETVQEAAEETVEAE